MAGIYCFNMGGNEASTNTGRLHTVNTLAPGQRKRDGEVEEHKAEMMLLDERARDISLGLHLCTIGILSVFFFFFFLFSSLCLPPLLCIRTQSLNMAAEDSWKQPPVDLGLSS